MSQKRKFSGSARAINGKRRRTQNVPLEEIAFNPSEREEYLTGFHKRKLQRIKQAQDVAAKREREEKLAARKQLREERKAELEKHVQAVNSALREAEEEGGSSGEDKEGEEKEGSWEGIPDLIQHVDHEDEYVDEERFTTVMVEAVDFTKDGLLRPNQEIEGEGDAEKVERRKQLQGLLPANGAKMTSTTSRRMNRAPDRGKKKKFRYESKADRKATRAKEMFGKRAKAKARRG